MSTVTETETGERGDSAPDSSGRIRKLHAVWRSARHDPANAAPPLSPRPGRAGARPGSSTGSRIRMNPPIPRIPGPPRAAGGGYPAPRREQRGACLTRREEGAYWAYATDARRSQAGCIAARMQRGLPPRAARMRAAPANGLFAQPPQAHESTVAGPRSRHATPSRPLGSLKSERRHVAHEPPLPSRDPPVTSGVVCLRHRPLFFTANSRSETGAPGPARLVGSTRGADAPRH